jgi:DNA-binding HxlR family transcriptional regulator
MRFHDLAGTLLASSGRIAVVSTLLKQPVRTWTGSGLARAAGVTPRWAIATLRALEAEGVVHAERVPPSWRWTLNRKHVLVEALSKVAALDEVSRQALLADLRQAVAPLKPQTAIWFGSTARGDEHPSSDVDLLVVLRPGASRERALDVLASAGSRFFWRFGNRLAPVVLTDGDFKRRKRGGFVREALATGVPVWGGRAGA